MEKLEEEIVELEGFLRNNNTSTPSEISKILRDIKEVDEKKFESYIQKIPVKFLGDIALELPDSYLEGIVDIIPCEKLKKVIEDLESDDQTDFIQIIEESNQKKAKKIFEQLDHEDQRDIMKLKKYPEESAGAYMQTEAFTALYHERLSDVIERFRGLKADGELENIYTLFILDENNGLQKAIGLEDIILFDFSKTFEEILESSKVIYKPVFGVDSDNIDVIIKLFEDNDVSVLPIVNENGKFVGRITSDDIYDLIQENATEQIYNLAGVDDNAEEEQGIWEAGRKRNMWLFLNLLTAITASFVIGQFESTLQSFVALAVLMPIVASMGGNAGTQTLTVVVRQLALGDIELKNTKSTIKKEVIISLANGFIFAIAMGLIASFWFADKGGMRLGVVIGLSMVINLLSAGFFGATIPLILKKINFDPAVGSTVLLTTVTDIVGFLSFLGLASLILL